MDFKLSYLSISLIACFFSGCGDVTVDAIKENTCISTTIEAENFETGGPVSSQITTSDGIMIRAGYDYIFTSYNFTDETTLTVTAKGEYANNEWPNMLVTIGSETVGNVFVESTAYKKYLFAIPKNISGINEIRITYTNDFSASEDRNIYIDKVTAGCSSGNIIPLSDCVEGNTRIGETDCENGGTYFQKCINGKWNNTTDCSDSTKKVAGERIIFETDFQFDIDDVGALAVLHGLQNEEKCTILAVSYNEVDDDGPGAIDAINTWYGRGDIPIGYYGSQENGWDSDHFNNYLNNNFTHSMNDNETGSSLDIYKSVLNNQPDNSVTIVSVGFLNNLYDLINDPEGYQLVDNKVKLLTVMGGLNNDNFNFTRHNFVSRTQYVIENWPGRIIVSQAGADIQTGPDWNENNPVSKAYELWGNTEGFKYKSWDPVAVLYAVTGTTWYDESFNGTGSLTNGFEWTLTDTGDKPRGFTSYVDAEETATELNRLMNLMPQ